MPQTTEEPQESLVVFWYKSEGEHVQAGDVLVEVQTEKATFDVESPVSGVVSEIRVLRGETAPVGQILVYIDEASRDESIPIASLGQVSGSGSRGLENRAPVAAGAGSFVQAPPRIRKLAKELAVDLASLRGTGPNGRITEEDVRSVTPAGPRANIEVALPDVVTDEVDIIPLTPTRRTIARRMMESLQQSAQLTLTAWADVTHLAETRARLAPGVSWNSWLMRAVVVALQQHPDLNASWLEEGIQRHAHVHLGIAVDTAAGLLVPVIRDADRLSLTGLQEATTTLTEAAQAGRVTSSNLTGSTFTVSNLGPYGVTFFTPVLNPPESAILGVGQVEEQVVLVAGQVHTARRLPLSLTVDHRVIDGAPAARFLQTVGRILSEPEKLAQSY